MPFFFFWALFGFLSASLLCVALVAAAELRAFANSSPRVRVGGGRKSVTIEIDFTKEFLTVCLTSCWRKRIRRDRGLFHRVPETTIARTRKRWRCTAKWHKVSFEIKCSIWFFRPSSRDALDFDRSNGTQLRALLLIHQVWESFFGWNLEFWRAVFSVQFSIVVFLYMIVVTFRLARFTWISKDALFSWRFLVLIFFFLAVICALCFSSVSLDSPRSFMWTYAREKLSPQERWERYRNLFRSSWKIWWSRGRCFYLQLP